jgi:DNA-binding transcriptional ArsR family regulator
MHMSDLCNQINQLGKGLGTASRYRIIEALFKGPKTVNELVKAVKLTQPAVSQHLKTLKTAQLVTDERKGQMVYYSVNAGYMLNLLKLLNEEIKKGKE